MKVAGRVALLFLLAAAFLVPLPLEASEESDILLARGLEKLNAGAIAEAADLFDQALKLSPDDPEALYYAGMANARLGRVKRAEELLLLTTKGGEEAGESYFELGRLSFLDAECGKAEEYFLQYLALTEDRSSRRYVEQLLAECGGSSDEEGAISPFRLSLSLGSEYDSNVILEPRNPLPGGLQAEDGRAVFYGAAGWDALRSDRLRLGFDYLLYQSLHFELENFNVNYQKIQPEVEVYLNPSLSVLAGYAGEYTFFGGDRYSLFHSLVGKVRLAEGQRFVTEIGGGYRDNHYWNSAIYPLNSIRNGNRGSIGITQKYNGARVLGKAFLLYENENAQADHWDYDGYRGGAEILYRLLDNLYLRLYGEYEELDYVGEFPGYGVARYDKRGIFEAGLTWILSRRLSLTLNESYTDSDSNIENFAYRRNILGVFLTWSFF